MAALQEIAEDMAIEPFRSDAEPDLYNLDAFEAVDWARLATRAGEPVDLKAWQAHARKRDRVMQRYDEPTDPR